MQPKNHVVGLSLGIAAVALGAFAFVHPAAAQSPAPFPAPGQIRRPHAGNERHPNLRRMMTVIERVKDNLQRDLHDYSGHRLAAIQALNQAESELNQALASDRK